MIEQKVSCDVCRRHLDFDEAYISITIAPHTVNLEVCYRCFGVDRPASEASTRMQVRDYLREMRRLL